MTGREEMDMPSERYEELRTAYLADLCSALALYAQIGHPLRLDSTSSNGQDLVITLTQG